MTAFQRALHEIGIPFVTMKQFFLRISRHPTVLEKTPAEIQLFNYYHHPSSPSFLPSSLPFFVITENYIPFLFLKQHNFERENDTSFK
jgi:hypothetical protein